jgi:hypothetical protein
MNTKQQDTIINEAEFEELMSGLDALVRPSQPGLFKVLIGSTITEVWINGNQKYMRFVNTEGVNFDFMVDGDCCSESWFADIFGFDKLLGFKITLTEVIYLDENVYNTSDGRGRQDYDKVYGFRIITEGGVAVISFRNSSNGYYGGDCYERTIPVSTALYQITPDENGIWQAD